MKKLFILLLCLLSVLRVYADPGDSSNNPQNYTDNSNASNINLESNSLSEEDLCFNILSENVKKSYNIDLSSVEKSSEQGDIINLSNYNDFKKHTVENPNQKYLNNTGLNIFSAKRNNIGTIKAEGDYILSQFTGFGDKTNFTFPLKSSNSNYDVGDKYPDFRQNILYTHHLLNGTFVSCGYLKVIPKGTHDLYSVSQNDYNTNIFEGSGFEISDSSIKKIGKNGEEEFLVGKVNISAIDYAEKPLFKIKLITVAYNNKSKYFNEFETFPKQVSAMTNPDSQKEGMAGVMIRFFNKVKNETCLELVNIDGDYPEKCNNKPRSLSFFNKILSFFSINNTFAAIQAVENYKEKMEDARGIVIYDGLPFNLYEKLQKITDDNLRNSLIAAILPNFEDIITYKQKNNIVLSPYEEIFIKCSMDYSQRMNNVKDFLTNLDINSKIDYNNFSYLDSKFGDCIIPYPDKNNLGKNIKDSFASLQKDYIKLDDISNEIEEKYSEILELESKINTGDDDLKKKIESGELITDEEIEKSNKEKELLEKEHKKLSIQLKELIEKNNKEKIEIKNNNEEIPKSYSHILYYILIGIVFIIGVLFIYLSIRRKK